MASVELPSTPGPAAVAWELVDFGGTLSGALGGMAQRVNRLGNRWRCRITMPPLTPAQAREWSSALAQGLRQGVLWKVRQVGFAPGAAGTPLVNGGSQAGNALTVDGLTALYPYRIGQVFSLLTGSRRYVHHVAGNGRANGSGQATLAIEPALRVTPADNSTVELAAPMLEGLLESPVAWSLDPNRLASGFEIVISEAR